MKVYKIKQDKSYYTVIFVENNKEITFKLNLDTIIKFDLCKDKELTLKEYEEIKKEAHFLEGFKEIMKFLKISRSFHEIEKYLKKIFDYSEYDRALELLQAMNLVNDEVFVTNFIYECIHKRIGRDTIKSELKNHRIDDSVIDEALYIYDDTLLEQNILYHIQKVFRTFHGSKRIFRQKIYAHLLNKNFNHSEITMFEHHIDKAIKKIDENRFLRQDFEKIIDKYDFIEDFEKRNKCFIHDLMQKGYDQDDIIKLIKEY